MNYDLREARALLGRTPAVLDALLRGVPLAWVHANEGPDTFSPFDVLGHLIHGERTDWVPRAKVILEHGESRPFEPFDRYAHRRAVMGRTPAQLLDEFASLRQGSLVTLEGWRLTTADLARRGRHPVFGPVTLHELLASWVVHDLEHVAQVARVMARQYADEVGPWAAYLPILRRQTVTA